VKILATVWTLVLIAGLAAALQRSQALDTPWKRRMRTGIVLDGSKDDRSGAPARRLTLEEMRRLGLRPRGRGLIDHAQTDLRREELGGIALVSPLDGYPRVVTSGLGEPRDHGKRLHRGIDFASEHGEPVRSVAPGVVVFAGVDWERRAHIALEPWGAAIVHPRHMGPRGLFVQIDHGDGVTSLYAHLARYDVKVGDRVGAGQRIGEVGRTGIRKSRAHLHFGLFQHGEVLDPLDHLAAYVFPSALTKHGPAELAKQHRPRTHQRHQRAL
jgi:murein DD-endopeptidase MepM/ murein hydrolase activator NlpD